MKTIILNAGPRKSWNTAQLLKRVCEGALSVGKVVEYIDLYDLNFTGCRSCLACKRKGIAEPCRCYWKDEFTPIIEHIYQSDALVIGSPVYYGEPTGVFRQALERICFPAMSYNDYSSLLDNKIDVDVILTMNVPLEIYQQNYEAKFETQFWPFQFLNGKVTVHPVCDTLQVNDYSRFDMAHFSEEHKKNVHETQFPEDLEMAQKIGTGDL